MSRRNEPAIRRGKRIAAGLCNFDRRLNYLIEQMEKRWDWDKEDTYVAVLQYIGRDYRYLPGKGPYRAVSQAVYHAHALARCARSGHPFTVIFKPKLHVVHNKPRQKLRRKYPPPRDPNDGGPRAA